MVDVRYFKWKGKWNVKFLPEQPNGFAVYLLSGQNGTVEESSCIWENHPEKRQFLDYLLASGYTVFTSELDPKQWGNEAVSTYCEQLVQHLLKTEILNKHIHLLAEGTGAITALKLVSRGRTAIRSMLFFNPCIYLEAYYEFECQNKLYYKKLKHELSQAYGVKPERINHQWVRHISNPPLHKVWPPLLLIHQVNERRYPLPNHSRKLEGDLLRLKQSVQLKLFSSTRRFDAISEPTVQFFQKHERIL